ncbi:MULTISPECIES: hypothetical protein [Auritidibacter]|uniref:hypothetical protein n=1 Tax=Auritidibacter TaxID=1160973 RepID=UPI000D738BCA|nr:MULTISPECIES: hypothetical protein [Auritidibacter]NIH71560.1 hypothetical protein [Auritidibacter ignavus]PXA81870.1 hypothetical protein DCC25_00320 [Auritidibacter sp. NML120636]RMX24286.1 hypothetical protein DYI20_01620 [Auritidibacter ignavus]WGH81658.1 hypothetical protein QDX25_00285 [Auritidibacter ignavus]WGH90871.1 hypothetical protein QDX23_00280 [Auritidibacter ignavus]
MTVFPPEENPPAPPVAGETDRDRPSLRQPIVTAVGAVCLGALVGFLGNVVHFNVVWIGSVALPWGVVLALGLVVLAAFWLTSLTDRLWASAVTILASYGMACLMAFWPGADVFSVPVSALAWQMMPVEVIAEAAWLLGIPVVGVVTMVILRVQLFSPRGAKTQQSTAQHESEPCSSTSPDTSASHGAHRPQQH